VPQTFDFSASWKPDSTVQLPPATSRYTPPQLLEPHRDWGKRQQLQEKEENFRKQSTISIFIFSSITQRFS